MSGRRKRDTAISIIKNQNTFSELFNLTSFGDGNELKAYYCTDRRTHAWFGGMMVVYIIQSRMLLCVGRR